VDHTRKLSLRGTAAAAPQPAPSDPLYAEQTQFAVIGGLETVWRHYSGTGIAVGIYDEGVQTSHWDLEPNYDASRQVVIDGTTAAPVSAGPHGTAVAGLFAAAKNGTGGVGVAYGAKIASIDIFDPASPAFINADDPDGFFQALDQLDTFDVTNHSWGADPNFAEWQNPNVAHSFDQEAVAGFAKAAAEGRDGRGTIIVQAAGNDDLDANGSGVNASRYSITVAAAGNDGGTSNWGEPGAASNFGACLLVTAPGGGNDLPGPLTTDLLGADGHDAGDYVEFGGTSAATPIVTGVVALMLDANPRLGWRDVSDILACSSTVTGSGFGEGPDTSENNEWIFNGATTWNNGGMHFSGDYGYGMLNALGAVRMAEAWRLFGPAETSANEATLTREYSTPTAIADDASTTYEVEVGRSIEIESIDVTVEFTHTWAPDLALALIAPDGSRVAIGDLGAASSALATRECVWTFGVEAFRGMSSSGTWALEVADKAERDTGTLQSVRLDFHGAAADADDIFHFTDDFGDMAALAGQGGRRTLSDTNGGTDWLDMAAVTTDIDLRLVRGAETEFDGAWAFAVAERTRIENAVTGDGHDFARGNTSDNALFGMRGHDTLNGARGDDRLCGGSGADRLTGGDGADAFLFRTPAESGRDGDTITDFQHRTDTIDLAKLDANVLGAGNQVFQFIGSARFSGTAGELRYADGLVCGDVDGDRGAELQIKLANAATLGAADFEL